VILQKASETPRRLGTFVVEWTVTSHLSTFCHRWYFDGDRFRIESTPVQAGQPGSGGTSTKAYNGTKYQSLNGDAKHLIESKEPLEERTIDVFNPLTPCYQFLFSPNERPSWHIVKDPQRWELAARSARFVGNQIIDNRKYSIVEFRPPNDTVTRRVFFAEDLGYFPMRWELYSATSVLGAVGSVTEFKQIDGVLIPIRIDLESFPLPNGRGGAKISVNADSSTLLVNEPIDQEIFTLGKSNLDMVFDLDKINAERELQKASPNDRSQGVWWTFGAILVGILLVAVYLAGRNTYVSR
jgi:hypothetical protein